MMLKLNNGAILSMFFSLYKPNFNKNKLSVDLLILDGYNNYAVKAKNRRVVYSAISLSFI